jgi:hypothetical protein
MQEQQQQQPSEQWAIVELFGHTRIAGRISEYTLGGCSFVRIDVPELSPGEDKPPLPGFTRLYSQGAIYSVTFVDETTARTAAAQMQVQPVDTWTIQQAIRTMVPDQVRRLIGDAQPALATADHEAEYGEE